MRVVYTDPAWALTEAGKPEPGRADLEREIFQPEIEMSLGDFHDGWATSGERLLGRVRGADAVVIYRCEVTEELVEALRPTCRVVARRSEERRVGKECR